MKTFNRKSGLADYVKLATSRVKKIDADDLADAFNRAGLPIEVRRRRETQVWKYLLIPVIGLALVGAIWMVRQLSCRDDLRKGVDQRGRKAPSDGVAPNGVREAAPPARDGSFSASDPPDPVRDPVNESEES